MTSGKPTKFTLMLRALLALPTDELDAVASATRIAKHRLVNMRRDSQSERLTKNEISKLASRLLKT